MAEMNFPLEAKAILLIMAVPIITDILAGRLDGTGAVYRSDRAVGVLGMPGATEGD